MTRPPAPQDQHLTDKAEAARQERLQREAAALRENLRRRKQQARTRADGNVAVRETDLAAKP